MSKVLAVPATHRTVSRAIAILELAAANPEGIALSSIATTLDAAKSSVHGFARGLIAEGYLREEAGLYFLGPAVAALLARTDTTASKRTLFKRARAPMQALQSQFDETVMLSTLVGNSTVYEMVVESSQLIRYSPPLNVRRPLYPPSSGKCFLAFMVPAKRAAYLSSIVDNEKERRRIEEEMSEIVRVGYALNRGETLPDISGVAAPIFARGSIVACIAIAGPSNRLSRHLDKAARAVLAASRSLSE